MANFDPNVWYQLFVQGARLDQAMAGTVLYQNGGGAVFFRIAEATDPAQSWQLYQFSSSYYVLRSKASGPDGYLNVVASSPEATPGGTVPAVHNYTVSDDSMFWQISPWSDGTFFLSNAANGSAWHLTLKPGALMAMSSNVTPPPATISPTVTPTLTTSIVTASILSTSGPSVTFSAISSQGVLSSGVSNTMGDSANSGGGMYLSQSAAVGGAVGGVGLIIVLMVGFIINRRRKIVSCLNARQRPMAPPKDYPKAVCSSELHELDVPAAELYGSPHLAELQGSLEFCQAARLKEVE